VDKLFTLLELQRRAQDAVDRAGFIHVALNETHRLVPYKQAVFWNADREAEAVSGNAALDPRGPYALEVSRAVRALTDRTASVFELKHEGLHVLVITMRTGREGVLGGLWLENDKPFSAQEQEILEELAASYGAALALHSLRARRVLPAGRKRRRALTILLLAAVMFVPVRLTATAPAEVVARDSAIVTVPFDGLMDDIKVRPGDNVTAGQVLAVMENSALTAQMAIAEQELKVAQSSLSRLQRESLSVPEKKAELTLLQQEINNKQIAYNYARDQRARSEIIAPRAGVAVFADDGALEGKPVAAGHGVMMIADPADAEILIRVPVDAAINYDDKAPVHVYMNMAPLTGFRASIRSIGYQASPDPDGLLTYKVRAAPEKTDKLRIGAKGTAKIKGDHVFLGYAIARRPLLALRRLTGW